MRCWCVTLLLRTHFSTPLARCFFHFILLVVVVHSRSLLFCEENHMPPRDVWIVNCFWPERRIHRQRKKVSLVWRLFLFCCRRRMRERLHLIHEHWCDVLWVCTVYGKRRFFLFVWDKQFSTNFDTVTVDCSRCCCCFVVTPCQPTTMTFHGTNIKVRSIVSASLSLLPNRFRCHTNHFFPFSFGLFGSSGQSISSSTYCSSCAFCCQHQLILSPSPASSSLTLFAFPIVVELFA